MNSLRSLRLQQNVAKSLSRRAFSASATQATKVAVLGAAGGIGQPLSLLLKLNNRVSDLALYDIRGTLGVAADIAHIDTQSTVKGYLPEDGGLEKALSGSEIIVIPAGVPRRPGMSRDDLFNTNASIVRDLAKAAAEYAPKANILVISNPVNSTVPICKEVLVGKGVYDPKRLFGVTTLDVVRAARFVSELRNTDPEGEKVTVVGGHSGVTIVPLLSQLKHKFEGEERDALVKRIQFGGDEVVQAKSGAGSATLSMAHAGAKFTNALLRAKDGESNVITPSFVESPLFADKGCEFFASNVELGPEGVKKVHPLGQISDYEQKLLESCLADLAKNIKKGKEFVSQNP